MSIRQQQCRHHPASFQHPSNTVEASNIYHGTEQHHKKPCWKIGFDLSCDILFSDDYLNVKTGDTFVDLGGGRADPSIVLNLINPRVRAVSIEIDLAAHSEAEKWCDRISSSIGTWSSVEDKPELINTSFLDDQVKELMKLPRLKIWFNNYGGKMTRTPQGGRGITSDLNVQSALENILNANCLEGTVIVSFDEMIGLGSGGDLWREEVQVFDAGKVDIDWYEGPRETNLYRYTRTSGNAPAVTNQVTTRKRRKRVTQSEIKRLSVIGLAELKGTSWESEYGAQFYPVIMLGGQKVRYMFEQPDGHKKEQMFEPDVQEHDGRVIPIYKDGSFNAGQYIERIEDSFQVLMKQRTTEDQEQLDGFMRRSVHIFNELSLLSYGSHENLKRSCSYVRVTRFLLSALTSLKSKAVFEFGAGKGILFATLKMYRKYKNIETKWDKAVDSKKKSLDWCTFMEGEQAQLGRSVQYYQNEMKDVESFRQVFQSWLEQVSNEATLLDHYRTPELLLISWPNTNDQDFVKCVTGWYQAGGERLAVIYDRTDREASLEGPFLVEIPGTSWSLMKDVLHDEEGNVKTYSTHMPHMSWGSGNGEVYQDSRCSYGLYVYQRI
eukprot:scaffold131539_cov43-Cyclotella_meneghiniana.AAC.11